MGILKNNYKILYEKLKTGFATKKLPNDDTSSKVTLYVDGDTTKETHLSDYKLIYEKNQLIYGSSTGFPSSTDEQISGLDEANEVVFGETIVPPTPSEDPIIKIVTTVPYVRLEGFGQSYTPGTQNIYLKIVGINDDYNYIAEGKDAAGIDIGFTYQGKSYDMGEPVSYEINVAEMPETDVTINFRIKE